MLYLAAIAIVMYFAPPYFAKWLAHQLQRPCAGASSLWRVAALISVICAIAIHATFYSTASNFILHALGGGAAAGFIYRYIAISLQFRANWKIDLLLLFAFVSMLGVLNEIAEFTMDVLHLSMFSFDRYDTWRDLVANTTGAFMGWIAIKIIKKDE